MKQTISPQSWLQLLLILIATVSLPSFLISSHLASIYGTGTALISCIMSGLLLWVIGLIISSLAWKNKSDAIENVSSLLGDFGAKLVSIVSIAAF